MCAFCSPLSFCDNAFCVCVHFITVVFVAYFCDHAFCVAGILSPVLFFVTLYFLTKQIMLHDFFYFVPLSVYSALECVVVAHFIIVMFWCILC